MCISDKIEIVNIRGVETEIRMMCVAKSLSRSLQQPIHTKSAILQQCLHQSIALQCFLDILTLKKCTQVCLTAISNAYSGFQYVYWLLSLGLAHTAKTCGLF